LPPNLPSDLAILRWRDAPGDYGPHKTIYNRFIRRSRLGVFRKISAALAHTGGKPERIMIDATHLSAIARQVGIDRKTVRTPDVQSCVLTGYIAQPRGQINT
jgi:putative transposase